MNNIVYEIEKYIKLFWFINFLCVYHNDVKLMHSKSSNKCSNTKFYTRDDSWVDF